ACTDVLARGRTAELARTAQAAAHDALAFARIPRRRSVPRLRNAGRRPAGSMVARLLPAPRGLRTRPSSCDRCAVVPHEPLPELVLPARFLPTPDRGRGPVRTSGGRRPALAPPRGRRHRRLVARASQR